MVVTLELSAEVSARLMAIGGASWCDVDAHVADFPAAPAAANRRLSFLGIGRSASGRSAADDNEMLAEGFGRD